MRLAIAFAVLLLAGCALAQTTQTYIDVCGPHTFQTDDAMIFIAATFALVLFGIALTYMYGKVREEPHSQVWAKDEAQNLAITVILFVGLLVFFMGSCAIAQGYANGNPFDASKRYISQLESNGQSVLRTLTYTSINDQKTATKYVFTGAIPFYGTGVATQANTRALSAHKELVIDIYLPIIASVTAQKYVLEAVQWVCASMLLPFAFVMRLFPFTREFGNILIAVFFGIYIVAPTLYAMSASVYMGGIDAAGNVMPGIMNPTTPPVLQNFYSYGLDSGGAGDVRQTVLYQIGSAIPQAIFIPNLVLVVTITCIMSMSKGLRAMAV